MRHRFPTGVALMALGLAACATAPLEQQGARERGALAPPLTASAKGGMPGFFDCLRETGAVLVSAHRGGAAPGYPENAIETFEHTTARMQALLEIDVLKSADGVLLLMHDETLDRTTTGRGPVTAQSFAALRSLRLKDNEGAETEFRIPTLEEALVWSEERAFLALDRKDPVTFDEILALVDKHDAFGRVVIATYSLDDAMNVAALAPAAMIVTPIESLEDLETLRAGGVDPAQVIAWTGTETPRPALYDALAGEGVESAFATLGWWTGSWDSRIRVLEDDTLYLKVTKGAHLVATDRHFEVAAVLPGVAKLPRCAAATTRR